MSSAKFNSPPSSKKKNKQQKSKKRKKKGKKRRSKSRSGRRKNKKSENNKEKRHTKPDATAISATTPSHLQIMWQRTVRELSPQAEIYAPPQKRSDNVVSEKLSSSEGGSNIISEFKDILQSKKGRHRHLHKNSKSDNRPK